MMKRGLTLTILLVATGALAQAPVSPAAQPKLSPAIPLAIQSLQQRSQQIQQMINELKVDFTAVDSQIRTEAPGWHLSQNLQIEKETVTTTPPATVKHPPLPATK